MNEKKLNAAFLNGAVRDLRTECEQLEKKLHEVIKQSNRLNRTLEHAVWEEDMVVDETIVFNCSLGEFIDLVGPLIASRRWTINGCHEVKPFLRSLDSLLKVCPEGKEKPLALGTLINAVQEYLSTLEND